MLKREVKKTKRFERKRRVRAKVSGTASRPRLSVFRSLRGIFVQAIDDQAGQTIAQANLFEVEKNSKNTIVSAVAVGKLLAKRLVALNIKEAVFDRSGYKYHGKIKAVADAVREGGIQM